MPMGYETVLAGRGLSLSGGQRQRIALARALARKPKVLVLDEATSHLDAATEEEVNRNLISLRCTQIIIAHRLSTIRNADLILVVEGGTVVEQGTHDDLVIRAEKYASLLASQRDCFSVPANTTESSRLDEAAGDGRCTCPRDGAAVIDRNE